MGRGRCDPPKWLPPGSPGRLGVPLGVMLGAQRAEVREVVGAAVGERDDVIDLDAGRDRAAVAVLVDVGALVPVAA